MFPVEHPGESLQNKNTIVKLLRQMYNTRIKESERNKTEVSDTGTEEPPLRKIAQSTGKNAHGIKRHTLSGIINRLGSTKSNGAPSSVRGDLARLLYGKGMPFVLPEDIENHETSAPSDRGRDRYLTHLTIYYRLNQVNHTLHCIYYYVTKLKENATML